MDMIETSNMSFKYSDGTIALDNVNFKAASGKIVALLGPNGAGKSTLFLHFNGILQPEEGLVKVEGKPVNYDKKGLLK